jgi:hypothetical protein
MDFMAALEPRAAAGDFLDLIVEEGGLDRRGGESVAWRAGFSVVRKQQRLSRNEDAKKTEGD